MTPITCSHSHCAPRLDARQFRAAMGPGLQASAVTEAILKATSPTR